MKATAPADETYAGWTQNAAPELAFIIPAYNEERFITRTLDAIHAALENGPSYEVIVVDNGSTDRTPQLARSNGARVLVQEGGTIASLRNLGANHARGAVLIFLDADVTLTGVWRDNFARVRALLNAAPRTLSGSMCSVPSDAGWLERTWYASQVDKSLSHLGSAHLIILRSFFDEIGGFNHLMETGEDYDFSIRVMKAGGSIHRLSTAVVEHHGFPRNIRQFVKREVWHGTGDFASLSAVLDSRVAQVAIAFVVLHIFAVIALLAGSPVPAVAAIILVLILCAASSIRSYRGRGLALITINAGIYYLYYGARALSLLNAFAVGRAHSRTRAAASVEESSPV